MVDIQARQMFHRAYVAGIMTLWSTTTILYFLLPSLPNGRDISNYLFNRHCSTWSVVIAWMMLPSLFTLQRVGYKWWLDTDFRSRTFFATILLRLCLRAHVSLFRYAQSMLRTAVIKTQKDILKIEMKITIRSLVLITGTLTFFLFLCYSKKLLTFSRNLMRREFMLCLIIFFDLHQFYGGMLKWDQLTCAVGHRWGLIMLLLTSIFNTGYFFYSVELWDGLLNGVLHAMDMI